MKIEDYDQEKFYDAVFSIKDGKELPHTSIHHVIKPIEKIFSFRVVEGKNIWKVEILENMSTQKVAASRRFSTKLEMAEWLWFQLQAFKQRSVIVNKMAG